MDKANGKREARAAKARARIKDRRRFVVGPPADGTPARLVPKEATRTVFQGTLRDPVVGEPVLADGVNQVKLGGDVLHGEFKGYRIMTLTLEERATCPPSCLMWRSCYGNAMPFTTRWRTTPQLMPAIERHVQQLLTERPLLVRLHALGDFYSMGYLAGWLKLLARNPQLAIFGFTAHAPDSKLGAAIGAARDMAGSRFSIRYSGRTGTWGAATVDFPLEQRFVGDMIVCPEQLDANRDKPRGKHCGNCCACFETDRGVLFITH